MGTRVVVSVLGKDRPRVVATIATTLADNGANIDDIKQSILDGDIFSMTMLVTLDENIGSFDKVQDALSQDATTLGMQVTIQREDVFRFMYEV